MTLLLFLLAIGSALFTVLMEKEDFLINDIKPAYAFHWFFMTIGIAVFILYYNYKASIALLICGGLIYIIISCIYLNVFGKHYKLNHFAVHILIILILTASSRINWRTAVYIDFSFILFYLVFTLSLNKWPRHPAESMENVRQILELGRMLNGIFLLIIALILFTNSVGFLESIAQFLFS